MCKACVQVMDSQPLATGITSPTYTQLFKTFKNHVCKLQVIPLLMNSFPSRLHTGLLYSFLSVNQVLYTLSTGPINIEKTIKLT